MNNPEIFFINQETGEKVKLNGISSASLSSEGYETPVNIHNAYNFECNLKIDPLDEEAKRLLFGDPTFQTARRLTDELNDLIEEYHAPGTPRRERRAIKREFDKIFKIFCKHCKANNIEIGFTKTNK